jgi:hypothetical protein
MWLIFYDVPGVNFRSSIKANSTTRFNDILIDTKNSFVENHFLFQPIIDDINIVNIELGIRSKLKPRVVGDEFMNH